MQKFCSIRMNFSLTVVKLRRNMCNKELGFRFRVEPSILPRTFITWINFLYCQFQDLNLWVPLSVVSNVLHSGGRKSCATVIIDCTEVQIDKPKNPLSQEQSYSYYKRFNTVKVRLDIPDFVPQKGQLGQKQLYRSKNLSSKRLHVERIISLGKTSKILTGPITFNIVSLSSRIIFVCFMRVNFRPKIIL